MWKVNKSRIPLFTPLGVILKKLVGADRVKGIEPCHIINSKDHRVSVHPFSRASTTDMNDFVKPLIRRKADAFILHVGCNDVGKNVADTDTIENLKDLRNCDFAFSECTTKSDRKGLGKKKDWA